MDTRSLQTLLARVKGLVFDLDGTLLDSEKYHGLAFAAAMREVAGYELTEAEKSEFVGNTTLNFASQLAARHALALSPPAVLERKHEVMREIFRAALFPGVQAFLDCWRNRVPMAVATNSARAFVESALNATHVRERFSAVLTIDDVASRKPDPEIILKTLQQLGTPAETTLVFEDTRVGIEAARAAGCPAVLVQTGPDSFRAPLPPDQTAYTWTELLRLSP